MEHTRLAEQQSGTKFAFIQLRCFHCLHHTFLNQIKPLILDTSVLITTLLVQQMFYPVVASIIFVNHQFHTYHTISSLICKPLLFALLSIKLLQYVPCIFLHLIHWMWEILTMSSLSPLHHSWYLAISTPTASRLDCHGKMVEDILTKHYWCLLNDYIEKNCIQSIQCCISRRSKTAKIKCYKLWARIYALAHLNLPTVTLKYISCFRVSAYTTLGRLCSFLYIIFAVLIKYHDINNRHYHCIKDCSNITASSLCGCIS